ncbi:TonB-dependent receptor [Fibrella forsythiae]|uniref:TonB-dependent receptor n=1 Tax=Fibrella forsythiae TaxID=2817061 RepID=A0ABS3JCR3_9BACT|nr:TonB-dependent receptor [Fibrella forsythiae]MBO0947798.1 TonB-dependent receptor [Fibrella forsythiae]
MRNLYCLFFFVLSSCVVQLSYGQTRNTTISGSFNALSFKQFAEAIEARTDYRFYFNPTDVDSLQVQLQVTDQPLISLLTRVFEGTPLRFAIDARNRVFITPNQPVRTNLPVGFFDRGPATAADDSAAVDYSATREKTRISLETKLFEIGARGANSRTGNATLAGRIRSTTTGEPAIGVYVLIEKPRIGVTTDQYGTYSITLPRGRHELKIRSIGMTDTKRQIMLYGDGKLDIDMDEEVVPLREVIVGAKKDLNVAGLQMGAERLDIRTIKQVPTVLGEADLIRVVLTLPGVKSVGEGTIGFNVRGGSAGQNLILFNDAVIYNPSHLFGFFSAFNPDVIKSVELYKSAIPARFGGRLSSVLDVTTRDGNKKKLVGSGGIGPLTGRLTLEGPLFSEKTSFLIGVRSTYSDWLLRQLANAAYQNSKASFYDLNLHLTHEANDKNTFYLTAYTSRDQFKLNSDSLYTYENQVASLKWKHIFSSKLYSVLTGTYSRYQYAVSSEKNPTNAFKFGFDIQQTAAKVDFNYYPNAQHTIDFGVGSTLYKLQPGNLQPSGAASLIAPDVVPGEQGLETALYIGDRFDVTPRLSLNVGLRYSLFQNLGPSQVYGYAPGLAKTTNTIQDTVSYGAGSVVKTYQGPEYRVGLRYAITDDLSVKASYNRMRQYLNMLSNTVAVSPLDIYKLSDSYIQPQIGDQFSLGLYKNLRANTIEVSLEGYYRTLTNQLDYKSGATLLLNHHLETDIVNAEGVAYGVELMVKKLTGKLNGWVSYTYARSLLRTTGTFASDVVNNNAYYPSSYDKPHDITLIGNYKVNRRFSISFNVTYSTGRPITLPLAKYVLAGAERVFYSERNQYRIPDYFRTDLSLNIEGNHKVKKLAHSSWTVGLYNLTGRRNPYSVYFNSANGGIRGYQLSIFGQPIPTLTYNFRF